MQHFSTILLIVLSTACATDVDSTPPDETSPTGRSCGTSGSASISGTVAGESISAARAGKIKLDADGFVVLSLDSSPGAACGDPGPTGKHLAFGFCSDPGVGMHAIGESSAFACPGGNPFAIVEKNEGEDLADATGGSITISSSDDDCTSGSFSVDFGAERLTGTFDAVTCP